LQTCEGAVAAEEVYNAELPAPEEVTAARRALDRWLLTRGVDEDLRDAVLLVATELVANAVQHARSGFTLAAEMLDDGAVRIDVFDRDTRLPVAGLADEDATGGRGLHLVSTLATDWGSGTADEEGISGKTVWAVVHPGQ
jgi:anti-sigma regulatory factor (Ser/Thr protein kinase)